MRQEHWGGQNGAPRRRGATTGRRAPALVLSGEERTQLRSLVVRRDTPAAVKKRSQVILACARGKTNTAIAQELGLTGLTVGKWRLRFLRSRLKEFNIEMRGRPSSKIVLGREERRTLHAWAQSVSCSAFSQRAKIILACAAGKSDEKVAEDARVSIQTAGNLRRRFLHAGVDGIRPAPRGRSLASIVLAPGEEKLLERWLRSARMFPILAQRAKVILACAQGHGNTSVAQVTGLSERTVGMLRKRFLAERLQGLNGHR